MCPSGAPLPQEQAGTQSHLLSVTKGRRPGMPSGSLSDPTALSQPLLPLPKPSAQDLWGGPGPGLWTQKVTLPSPEQSMAPRVVPPRWHWREQEVPEEENLLCAGERRARRGGAGLGAHQSPQLVTTAG